MENFKGTIEYAKQLANESIKGTEVTEYMRMSFVHGYMKAVEQTNAKDLLEALLRARHNFITSTWTEETYNIIDNAINKSTK